MCDYIPYFISKSYLFSINSINIELYYSRLVIVSDVTDESLFEEILALGKYLIVDQ